MAYTWTTGETITAEKLNNTGSGVLIVNVNRDENTGYNILSKTWKEIYDAFQSGTMVLCKSTSGGIVAGEDTIQVVSVGVAGKLDGGSTYVVNTFATNSNGYTSWSADSETGYPRSAA